MAEDNPFVGLYEVLAVIVNFARRGAPVVEGEHAGGDPFGIEAVSDGVRAERGDEEVSRVDRLGATGGQDDISPRAEQRYGQPDDVFDEPVHQTLFLLDGYQRRNVRMIRVSPEGSISNTNNGTSLMEINRLHSIRPVVQVPARCEQ